MKNCLNNAGISRSQLYQYIFSTPGRWQVQDIKEVFGGRSTLYSTNQ